MSAQRHGWVVARPFLGQIRAAAQRPVDPTTLTVENAILVALALALVLCGTGTGALLIWRTAASEARLRAREADLAQVRADLAREIDRRQQSEEEGRRLEAQLQHAQRLESLGVLASSVAHDFNNLLVGILGNADLALLEPGTTEVVRERLQTIGTAARRAAELTNQLLTYSGRGKAVVHRLNLSGLVEEMVRLLETVISKKAMLQCHFATGLPPVEVDAAQVRQVIMNLIINASDALGDQSGVLTITTGIMDVDCDYLAQAALPDAGPEGQYVYAEVSDTGCGMDRETEAKIFEPFFSTKVGGRGLGLAAVLGIVRAHRGTIRVHSEPGKGTTFRVLFPRAAHPQETVVRAPEGPQAWQPGGSVLIVDDEEDVRSVAQATLERAGFSVLTARNGREGVETFRAHAQDIVVVLLDMMMPEMTGEAAFDAIRRLRDDTRVILSSGYAEQDVTRRLTGKGLAGFIQKPYPPSMLVDTVRAAMQKVAGREQWAMGSTGIHEPVGRCPTGAPPARSSGGSLQRTCG